MQQFSKIDELSFLQSKPVPIMDLILSRYIALLGKNAFWIPLWAMFVWHFLGYATMNTVNLLSFISLHLLFLFILCCNIQFFIGYCLQAVQNSQGFLSGFIMIVVLLLILAIPFFNTSGDFRTHGYNSPGAFQYLQQHFWFWLVLIPGNIALFLLTISVIKQKHTETLSNALVHNSKRGSQLWRRLEECLFFLPRLQKSLITRDFVLMLRRGFPRGLLICLALPAVHVMFFLDFLSGPWEGMDNLAQLRLFFYITLQMSILRGV